MKRIFGLLLVLCLLYSSSALAVFDYTGHLNNEATFETLEEARASAPAVVAGMPGSIAMGNTSEASYAAHPALNDFPANTAYVYRSPDMYSGFAAARMNSTFLVYAEQVFTNKDAAFEYIKGLGLIEIVDHLRGSIVLVTPANGEKGFAAADQKNYYLLQTAICALKAKDTVDGKRITRTDSDYYGTFKNLYVIGIDGGATFLNNYVAGTEDFVGRIAGLLLVNGEMAPLSKVASLVPAYLVNADTQTIAKYQEANEVNALKVEDGKIVYFNQEFPLRKVIAADAKEVNVAAFVQDAYDKIFAHTMRIQVYKTGYLSAGTPYQYGTGDCAPYSLNHRCEIIDGVTEGGTKIITMHDTDMFKDIKTADGEYLTTWYEILPATVVNNTAAPASVPLILGLAGTGDDPLQYAEEIGLIALSETEGLAVVSPGHEGIFEAIGGVDGVEYETQPKLIQYMLIKYPALDPTRVYVTGYSRGGRTTLKVVNAAPEMIAAAVPMAANQYIPTEAHVKHLYETKMPIMFLTSTADAGTLFDANINGIAPDLLATMNKFADYNKVAPIADADSEKYPLSGFVGDSEIHILLNGEYQNHRYFKHDANHVPMLGISITEGLQHALYPSYAFIAWDYMEHFSRNPKTYEIIYTADPSDF